MTSEYNVNERNTGKEEEYLEIFIKGSIMGYVVGDAIAYPYRFQNKIPKTLNMVAGPNGEPLGSYSANSIMLLSTISSIVDCDDINAEDIMTKYCDSFIGNYLHPNEDISVEFSRTNATAITNFSNSISIDKCGLNSDNDNDNGCFPRILPIALYCASMDFDQFINQIDNACYITHQHVTSRVSSAILATFVRNLVLQKAEKVFDALEEVYLTNRLDVHKMALDEIRKWTTMNTTSGSMNVVDTLWTIINAFKSDWDYTECIGQAISKGNDTTSSTSASGFLCALSNGLNDIPSKWLFQVSMNGETMDIINRFIEKCIRKLLK